MKKPGNITESEWPIMRVLWDKNPATASEIVEAVTSERDVSMRTVKTLLRRLIAKNLVGYTVDPDDQRIYHYSPLIPKEAAVKQKSDNFVEQIYQNNVGDLLAHFVEDSGLSEEELGKLQNMVQKKLQERRRS